MEKYQLFYKMPRIKQACLGLLAMFCFAAGCKDRYTPVLGNNVTNLLVVEGFINAGGDSTIIKLSRTVQVSSASTLNPETNATVSVESESNESFPLGEIKAGVYSALPLSLNASKKYRVKIRTRDGSTYQSDLVEVKLSPPIDKIGWTAKPNGLQIYANTHDASKKSIYYRWEFEDSWIFFAKFRSQLIWRGQGLDSRAQSEDIYKCWSSGASTKIALGSSAKLNDDIINEGQVVLIPPTSEKLSETYSILVKQYALTKEAYDFWDNLRKNTESLGSIFDAQPSQLTGNIHNTANPAEPVLGFISAGSVQKQRIFVNKRDLPNWTPTYPYNTCVAYDVVPNGGESRFSDGTAIPLEYEFVGGVQVGTRAASRECADCTIRGTTKKPSFWP